MGALHRTLSPTRRCCHLLVARPIASTLELAAALEGTGQVVESHIFPEFCVNHYEGHLLERSGPVVWATTVRRFLERYL